MVKHGSECSSEGLHVSFMFSVVFRQESVILEDFSDPEDGGVPERPPAPLSDTKDNPMRHLDYTGEWIHLWNQSKDQSRITGDGPRGGSILGCSDDFQQHPTPGGLFSCLPRPGWGAWPSARGRGRRQGGVFSL